MDYSLVSYLSRRPIKETEKALLYYMEESCWETFRVTIDKIFLLLEKRYAQEQLPMPPEIAQAKLVHQHRLSLLGKKKEK